METRARRTISAIKANVVAKTKAVMMMMTAPLTFVIQVQAPACTLRSRLAAAKGAPQILNARTSSFALLMSATSSQVFASTPRKSAMMTNYAPRTRVMP